MSIYNTNVCQHGGLERKCEICERDTTINDLQSALTLARSTAEALREENERLSSMHVRVDADWGHKYRLLEKDALELKGCLTRANQLYGAQADENDRTCQSLQSRLAASKKQNADMRGLCRQALLKNYAGFYGEAEKFLEHLSKDPALTHPAAAENTKEAQMTDDDIKHALGWMTFANEVMKPNP